MHLYLEVEVQESYEFPALDKKIQIFTVCAGNFPALVSILHLCVGNFPAFCRKISYTCSI